MPTDQPIAYLPWDRYLELIRSDTDRLLAVATDLDAPVPSCPGWTVRDLVEHVAYVYLHKTANMRFGGPQEWPEDADSSDPVALLRRAVDDLLEELRTRGPHEERYTWWEPDQSNGFWYRRMALEIAVHRIDGELAAGEVTPVADDIAVDGIDEILSIFLAQLVEGGDDWVTGHPIDAKLRVTIPGRSWTAEVSRTAVQVVDEADSDVATEIAGSAPDVFLWLWGRQSMDVLSVSGDDAVAAELRGRLAEDD